MSNVTLNEGFKQVCVWPGTVLGDTPVSEFVEYFANDLNTRIQFLETVITKSDYKDGYPVEGTGGRSDIFFAVHNDDVAKFAVPRLKMGIRWIEDVYGNSNGHLYPTRIAEYKCWTTS